MRIRINGISIDTDMIKGAKEMISGGINPNTNDETVSIKPNVVNNDGVNAQPNSGINPTITNNGVNAQPNNGFNSNMQGNVMGSSSPKMTGSPWLLLVMGLAFFGIGIVLLINSPAEVKKQQEKVDTYIKTIGNVDDVDSEYDSLDEEYEYEYTVSYEVDGKVYYAHLQTKTDKYSTGDDIEVRYNPKNPRQVIWDASATSVYGAPIMGGMFTVLGALASILGIRNVCKKK